MTWREVWLRFQGILQSQAPLRRAAYLVHRSLIEKPINIEEEWPLPFDAKPEDKRARYFKVKQRLLEKVEQLKKQHGSPTA